MGIISSLYKKHFVSRYDKEIGVPYYSPNDFKDLRYEEHQFINSNGNEIHYFFFYYDNYLKDKIVLFLPGIGPGHVSYFAEIHELAKRGFKVLTIDYNGCGYSKGKCLNSLNQPTQDTIELLDKLHLKEEILLVGHSLGGYTSLNVINLRKDITKAVVISPFLTIKDECLALLKSKFLVNGILRYERKTYPELFKLDNIEYLKTTKDKIFFIQSTDDYMVPYATSLKVVESIDNPNIKTRRYENRKHNPNYTENAVNYMSEVFGEYNYLLKKKQIKTDDQKIAYFKDVSISKLVEQDQSLFDEIKHFLSE